MMKRFASIMLTSLIISACTPQPYIRYKTPNIHGSLLVNDSPAVATAIYLSLDADDTACKRFIQRAFTDEQGRFLLESEKEALDYTPLMTHYLDAWAICAEVKGVIYPLYSNNRYGMGSVGSNVTIDCRINTQTKNENPCHQPAHD